MEILFPILVSKADVPAIPGLTYLPDYLTKTEEQALVEVIKGAAFAPKVQGRRARGKRARASAAPGLGRLPGFAR
jgi:hypothetical protein